MKIAKIKPIPKYILAKIKALDKKSNNYANPYRRFYSYLTKNDGELVKVTVAVKENRGKWYCKQVAVHGLDSKHCYAKDLNFFYIGGYTVGWFEEKLYNRCKWWEGDGWCSYRDKDLDPYAPIVNKDFLKNYPEFKYSGYELYDGGEIIQFLRTYRQFPQVEYLLKSGFSYLATSRTLLRQMKKDKSFHKWLVAHKTEVMSGFYYIETILEAYKSKMPFDKAQIFLNEKKPFMFNKELKPLKQVIKGEELKRFFEYIRTQKTTYRNYQDYLEACLYLGIDMTLKKNRYPKNFALLHDIRIDQKHAAQTLADKKERKELYKNFSKAIKKYLPLSNFEHEDFIMVIAKSPAELQREGTFLSHCVGKSGYDQRVVDNKSLIFFVRKKEYPNTPFVTVEYSPQKKEILQSHGKGNCAPDSIVRNFIENKWLPFANQQIKQLAA